MRGQRGDLLVRSHSVDGAYLSAGYTLANSTHSFAGPVCRRLICPCDYGFR